MPSGGQLAFDSRDPHARGGERWTEDRSHMTIELPEGPSVTGTRRPVSTRAADWSTSAPMRWMPKVGSRRSAIASASAARITCAHCSLTRGPSSTLFSVGSKGNLSRKASGHSSAPLTAR